MRCTMTNGACRQEETCFEKRVGENVEHRWHPCTCTEAHHHVAELADC